MFERVLPQAAVTVDLVILTVREERLQLLLVERGNPPFIGAWALPGGFVEADEDLDQAADRELEEETGLDSATLHVEQLGSYGAPGRDPRGRIVTVCYVTLMPDLPLPRAGGDASAAQWTPVEAVLSHPASVAFDHYQIITDAVERARNKLEYTTLGATFCQDEFTIAELRRIYEIVWGHHLDPRNFHRKVTSVDGFLKAAGTKTHRNGGRPAALYRRGPAVLLHPPILRTQPTHPIPGHPGG
ncbi:NUDIX hydrolase [Saccharopolyspora shandongensis]|uniref:NUDIX hydrolase n=1 Tax=Saccharopolyspora shandongensis TaxID=418495 RepID=UPI0033CAA764